jgi:diguanylate cyclase (GGDEF)-like protein
MNLARSTEGAFSPSEIRLLTLLADQAAIAIVNARLHHAVSQLARIDGLTGLPNRRSLDEHLEQEINRARVTDASFSVIMLDVDGFKTINDIHGHEAGDDILKQVAAALVHALRSTDFLARYGGDELTLILPETDLPQAQVVADKIHARMQSLVLRLPGKQTTNLGISGGIAMYPRHGDSATSLLRAADEALYRAKRSGRNRSMVAADA